MKRRTLLRAAALVAAGVGLGAQAQHWPSKPIKLVVPFTAGGSTDTVARIVAEKLTPRLGQPVIVENRASVMAIETAAKSAPDGYTLIYYGGALWIGPLMQRMPYDPIKDFAPVSLTTTSPAVLVVHPAVPVKSVKDLIALAKAKPGELNYGSGGAGSTPHLAAELFNSMAGVKIVRVSYKGVGPAMNSLIGGEIQLLFATTGSVGPHVKSGKLRAVAVTSARPSILVPELPTVATVVPGYDFTQIQGVFAPAKTPVAIVTRFSREIAGVLAQTDVKERFLILGTEAVGSTPEVLAQAVKEDMARMGKVIKEAGIRTE